VRLIVLAAVVTLCAGVAQSQNPTRLTRVRVADKDGVPIPFASVSVNSGDPGYTDADGMLTMKTETGETARLYVRRMGYRPVETKARRDSTSGAFSVELEPILVSLATMKVTARRSTPLSRTGFYDRATMAMKGAFPGQFYGPEDLDAQSAGRMSELLLTSRYVNVVSKGGLLEKVLGRGGCEMLLLLDGRWVRGPIDETTGAGQLMAVEVYPSISNMPIANLPPMMGSSCGVIVMWTGSRR
jgi:hypothetical protein